MTQQGILKKSYVRTNGKIWNKKYNKRVCKPMEALMATTRFFYEVKLERTKTKCKEVDFMSNPKR
jgi:hypothetical protein